jgi:hypothetical protein
MLGNDRFIYSEDITRRVMSTNCRTCFVCTEEPDAVRQAIDLCSDHTAAGLGYDDNHT